MSEWGFVVAAYSVTWIVLVAYGVYLAVRARRVAAELRTFDEGRPGK
ncbi:MAG: CcmD family protein [Longimicrobiales bacterium]